MQTLYHILWLQPAFEPAPCHAPRPYDNESQYEEAVCVLFARAALAQSTIKPIPAAGIEVPLPTAPNFRRGWRICAPPSKT